MNQIVREMQQVLGLPLGVAPVHASVNLWARACRIDTKRKKEDHPCQVSLKVGSLVAQEHARVTCRVCLKTLEAADCPLDRPDEHFPSKQEIARRALAIRLARTSEPKFPRRRRLG